MREYRKQQNIRKMRSEDISCLKDGVLLRGTSTEEVRMHALTLVQVSSLKQNNQFRYHNIAMNRLHRQKLSGKSEKMFSGKINYVQIN